jgi:ATP-binding cassette, subfamily F, member 3
VIRLEHVQITFADKVLFKDLSWHVRPGERIGLVGDNGTGKTTLMKVMTSEMEADKGTVRLSPRITTGFLKQDFSFSSTKPLLEVTLEAAGDLKQVEREIHEVQQILSQMPEDHQDLSATLAHLGHLQDLFDHRGGFRVEAEAKQILSGLGFSEQDQSRSLAEFSGGWQMRAAMARLLLASPDLLLLDEPTNHLDTESLEWLERYLRSYDGTVVVISHDRFFLDRTVTRVAQLIRGELREYHGNYSSFQKICLEDQKQILAEYESAKGRIAELTRFIDRFRYKASKASQVQSRVKMLEKIELPEIERDQGGIHFRFPACERSGDIVLETKSLGMDYGSGSVFEPLDLLIKRGERVALVGANGTGKSTLVRLISGLLEPTQGLCKLGHKVALDVYTQEVEEDMDADATVLEEMSRHNRGMSNSELRGLLGCFLFSGSAVFKKVGVLSGGEKSRLAVAGILLKKSNFLLLDEPTNHLDIKAKDMLQKALANHQGTVLIVSHDRYFLDAVVDRVLVFREGRLYDEPGNYSEYLARMESRAAKEAASNQLGTKNLNSSGKRQQTPGAATSTQDGLPAGSKMKKGNLSRDERKAATQEKIRRGRILRVLEERATKIENVISKMEERMHALEMELMSEAVLTDAAHMKRATIEYTTLRAKVEKESAAWELALEAFETKKMELEA